MMGLKRDQRGGEEKNRWEGVKGNDVVWGCMVSEEWKWSGVVFVDDACGMHDVHASAALQQG